MDIKKGTRLMLFIALLLFSTASAFAEDYEMDEGILTDEDILKKQSQEQILQIAELSQKIDSINEQSNNNTQLLAEFVNNKIDSIYTSLLVSIVICILAGIGIQWAIYLYLKSKRLI